MVFAVELIRPAMGIIEEEKNDGRTIVKQRSVPLVSTPQETDISDCTSFFSNDIVCVGGTFDHMHLGHCLLLTQACLVTGRVLHCGVTSDALLTRKAYATLIEPFNARLDRVKKFLSLVAPHL